MWRDANPNQRVKDFDLLSQSQSPLILATWRARLRTADRGAAALQLTESESSARPCAGRVHAQNRSWKVRPSPRPYSIWLSETSTFCERDKMENMITMQGVFFFFAKFVEKRNMCTQKRSKTQRTQHVMCVRGSLQYYCLLKEKLFRDRTDWDWVDTSRNGEVECGERTVHASSKLLTAECENERMVEWYFLWATGHWLLKSASMVSRSVWTLLYELSNQKRQNGFLRSQTL